MVAGLISGSGRPVFRSITRVCVIISGWMSQFGTISSRTSCRLPSSSRRDQPGSSRSSQPTQAGAGTTLNLPFTPSAAHHWPNSRRNASGISAGQLFQGFLYSARSGQAASN